MKLLILLFFILIFKPAYTQETYNIKDPSKARFGKCKTCHKLLAEKPQEVQFYSNIDEAGNVSLWFNDEKWFDQLFSKRWDGVAIDLVSQNQYNCHDDKQVKRTWASHGKLLPPVYRNELRQNLIKHSPNLFECRLGRIPIKLLNKEVESNLLILKNKYLCRYQKTHYVANYKWQLLDLGLFMDTLVYSPQMDTTKKTKESIILQTKRMRFVFPFEKNKSQHSAIDIKPLYDSLRLRDYTIKNVQITAYSSVEGNLEHNIELQNQRANSILAALQATQELKINAKIIAEENWIEFYQDIAETKFEDFSSLPQSEVKNELKNVRIANEIEPILQKHRKAILVFDLEKKTLSSRATPAQILEKFEKSIPEKNIKEAVEIQKIVFSKIIDHKLPNDFLKAIEIPAQKENSILFNNEAAFEYFLDKHDAYESYLNFKKLEDLYPEDGRIKYNVCAMKFNLWQIGKNLIEPNQFAREIDVLKKLKINPLLVKRMQINNNIIACEHFMDIRSYQKKDSCLKLIYGSYRNLSLKESEALSIAQYFVSYAKYDWAIQLLKPYVKVLDVNEDLLFYFLSLTISDDSYLNSKSYRGYLINARNRNKPRFCNMFEPLRHGGISFQLLDNEFVKKMHCESCDAK